MGCSGYPKCTHVQKIPECVQQATMLTQKCPSCAQTSGKDVNLFRLKIFDSKMNDQVKDCMGDSGVFCLSKDCDVNFAKLLKAGKGKK